MWQQKSAAVPPRGRLDVSSLMPRDPDEVERRRHTALAGHRGQADHARAALGDPDATVRATALGALSRIGALTAVEVRAGLMDPSAVVRRRAAELAEPSLAARLGAELAAALADTDATVVEATAEALGPSGYAPASTALAATAESHPDPRCREAAAAALAVLGADAAEDTLIAAAADPVPAVRRRAVIAIGSFEDPSAEAIEVLRRSLSDPDLQVRQAAQDLLG